MKKNLVFLAIFYFILQAECADIIVKLDGYGKEEMAAIMQKFNVVSPVTGNKLSGRYLQG